jgi:hypothetical protein
MLRRNIATSRNLDTDLEIVNPILLQCSNDARNCA